MDNAYGWDFSPKVMIVNERAGSGGDLLPYMFKQQELGPIVGAETWGGLVEQDTPPFIDDEVVWCKYAVKMDL
jgi:C-terminal processing protease CtpA/Prc